MDCERCVTIHGPGCAASTVLDGKALCIFCEDGIACPTQRRILKYGVSPRQIQKHGIRSVAKQAIELSVEKGGEMMGENEKQKSPTSPARPVTAPAQTRHCKILECARALGPHNTTGLCHDHRGRGRRRSKTNGHAKSAASVKANGHGNGVAHAKANGHAAAKVNGQSDGHELTLEERVNLIICALPLDEKVRVISSWLRAGDFEGFASGKAHAYAATFGDPIFSP